jgi:hypothetical protein
MPIKRISDIYTNHQFLIPNSDFNINKNDAREIKPRRSHSHDFNKYLGRSPN